MQDENNSQNSPRLQQKPGGFGPRGQKIIGGEKPKNFCDAIVKLCGFSKAWLPIIIVAGILSIGGQMTRVYGPSQLSKITDIVTQGLSATIDVEAVLKIAVFLLFLYVLGWIFNFSSNLLMAHASQNITKKLRSNLCKKVNNVPLSYFGTTTTGNIMSRIANDSDIIGTTLNQSLGTLISALALFVGSVVFMFITNWTMAIAAVLSSLIGFFIVFGIVSHSQKYFNEQQEELGKLNGIIEETYAGHTVVHACNAESVSKEEFVKTNERLFENAWKSQFLSGLMQPLMGFVGNFGYVVVCILGAVLTLNHIISFGVVVAFMIYVRQFTEPLSQIAQAITSLQSAAAATERISELLEQEEIQPDDSNSVAIDYAKGEVEFDHVKFGYKPEKIIIKDFSAVARPGQKIAIVGPTGAGKTTLVNLLMRFYELNDGSIKIDGIPTTKMTRASVHNQFCMVLQDTWIFDGTIKENIIYCEQNVTDKQVIDACKAVGLHHYITTLPNGYNTVLNGTESLSAGQKQLITIARAMIRNASMLILDEATSSIDTRTEQLIENAMDKLMSGRTSFVIAHRLSTIKNANLILVMSQGEIVESGTHEKLLKKDGKYAELYNSQFEE